MQTRWLVLLVEDDEAMRDLLLEWMPRSFRGQAVDCHPVATLESALTLLQQAPVDVVLLDLNLPDSAALGTLGAVVTRAPKVPCIVVTGLPDEDLARQAADAGADDYLPKVKLTAERLQTAITYAIARHVRNQQLFAALDAVSARLKRTTYAGEHEKSEPTGPAAE